MSCVQLSRRLSVIASFVSDGMVLADVGTDHGYVPIYLCESGRIPSAIAMDVRKGPLMRAEEHVRDAHLEDRIECRLSDGFDSLRPGEADSAVISGMGGLLICRILGRGVETVRSLKELILSPQSDPASVRRDVLRTGFVIDREAFIEDEGKYYPVLHCIPGKAETELLPEEAEFGPCLLREQNRTLYDYLRKMEKVYASIDRGLTAKEQESALSPQAKTRQQEIRKEMQTIASALKRYEK
ncbi:MAG: class I SAM-dependent methyltransferase [Eubacteriales bacterium]|jgi:tRNA (adenine22-N1)-methyltransferase